MAHGRRMMLSAVEVDSFTGSYTVKTIWYKTGIARVNSKVYDGLHNTLRMLDGIDIM
jgi:hypothetical protein